MKKETIQISGMTCAACTGRVERVLNKPRYNQGV